MPPNERARIIYSGVRRVMRIAREYRREGSMSNYHRIRDDMEWYMRQRQSLLKLAAEEETPPTFMSTEGLIHVSPQA